MVGRPPKSKFALVWFVSYGVELKSLVVEKKIKRKFFKCSLGRFTHPKKTSQASSDNPGNSRYGIILFNLQTAIINCWTN